VNGFSELHRRRLTKPDGRALLLYGRAPIDPRIEGVAPPGGAVAANPHMRWHPLRGEWVAYASHRQDRTFLPPEDYDPLSPTTDPSASTELPSGQYDVAVFENRFPTFFQGAHDAPRSIVTTAPARGTCEVVVYTQARSGSLGALPLWHVEIVLRALVDRTRELGARPDIEYVFPFENRGVEVGVTLHHPHGQIYAYPFVPPIARRELEQQSIFYAANGRGLLEDHLAHEREDGRRVIVERGSAIAILPACARYAYEVWIAPIRAAPLLTDLGDSEIADLAAVLKTSLLKLDGLWKKPMPYILVVHQAPTDGRSHPEAHVHIEIYPALRMPQRLKYLAGSETGAGAFTADTIPEEKAAELRAVEVTE
jgi:UDPglucose--hexose-1-phosphate uridylyltransferase